MKSITKKTRTAYYCSGCGAEHPKWQGQCRECGSWNSLIEEKVPTSRKRTSSTLISKSVRLSDIDASEQKGHKSGLTEFDRVLGGQLVPGMTILLAGEPGIGKSTLLLQVANQYASQGLLVLYVTGEESLQQIRLRAERLSVNSDRIEILNDTSLENIKSVIENGSYEIILVDSIQTIRAEQFDSTPGTVGQVREASATLISLTKAKNLALFLVGHVTKEGLVAGPKVLEHMVDTVVSFEGDSSKLYRMLRTTKNRFGSVHEIGLFEMTASGLVEVSNPSSLFLNEHAGTGAVVAGLCEGSRPLMVEVQALVTPSSYGTAQRVAGGIDSKKLALLLAILEKRCQYPVGSNDVFVSIAGGLRVTEPALDLPVQTAIVSSLLDRPVSSNIVVIGEVGLSGEVRAVSSIEQRVAEAARLGFKRAVIPEANVSHLSSGSIEIIGAKDIQSVLEMIIE